ncbi:cell division protein ZapE [Mycoavidus sp. B2-EB]|uniref:cell division protein ZapE n=1 Tax=Mycoavidus sp. B2-EB TaxID=2651972 RepID=UPI0016287F83|nr:cell division protein ZapE [Mycoavidus sp. B2-EB]BBO59746.1 cell division protein ZapE [Mycoavidus sp. B2-EB]
MNVIQYYERELETRGYRVDSAQHAAVASLQRCYEQWVKYQARHANVFMKLLSPGETPKGVYMWGGVGRGKSFLMDSFYACVPLPNKIRLHFHEFMREVHRQLDELKKTANPLDVLARDIAQRYRLICFDEFHVSDIADAMILHRLLERLFKSGVQFVTTSNYHPATLYPEGLHRDRILPAIDLLSSKLEIINVDGGVDYRQRTFAQANVYYTPLSPTADEALRQTFAALAAGPDESPLLRIEQRKLLALRRAGRVVWFDFATLCGGPRSQNDYLELANRFHTIILSGVPQMTPRMASEARRFTWLIDVLYDHKVKLLISAEVTPTELYFGGPLANEFARTVSRIIEMQSKTYLEAPNRSTVDTSLT